MSIFGRSLIPRRGSAADLAALEAEILALQGQVAELEGDLLPVTAWVDLTAAITAACAGAPVSDPDSLASGLSITTSSATVDGVTVPVNLIAGTTADAANDGYNEHTRWALPTLSTLFGTFDSTKHALELEAEVVAAGTLNSTQPLIGILSDHGTTRGGIGWSLGASNCYPIRTMGTANGTRGDAGSVGSDRLRARTRPLLPNVAAHLQWTDYGSRYLVEPSIVPDGAMHFYVGQWTNTQAAFTGVSVRFRARLWDFTSSSLLAAEPAFTRLWVPS